MYHFVFFAKHGNTSFQVLETAVVTGVLASQQQALSDSRWHLSSCQACVFKEFVRAAFSHRSPTAPTAPALQMSF